MDRTRKLAEMILQRHPEAFGSDYDKNKVALVELALIPSKQLRNHIAGYLARTLREDDVEVPEETPETTEEEKAE